MLFLCFPTRHHQYNAKIIKHTAIDDKLRKMLCFMHTNFSLTYIQFIELLDFLFSFAHEAFSISHAPSVYTTRRGALMERESIFFVRLYINEAAQVHTTVVCARKSQKISFFLKKIA